MTARPDELLEQLAIACRELAYEGHEDGNWAHLAVRDPGGRGLWLKRNGVGLSEIDGPEDFVLLDFDGRQLAGDGGRHMEWPIHAEIMRARADVHATAHTHAVPLQLFSGTDVPLQQLIHESSPFVHGLPRFRATCDLIDTPELGRLLAADLGDARAVLMANHGATVTGSTVPELGVMALCLAKAVDVQRALAATGWPVTEADHEEAARKAARSYSPAMIPKHWSYYERRDARRRRAG